MGALALFAVLPVLSLCAPIGSTEPKLPLGKVSDLGVFVTRLEKVWKHRDWRTLASVATPTLRYMTSEDVDDYFTFKGKDRGAFLKEFVRRMRVDRRAGGGSWRYFGRWKSEKEYWNRSFSQSWKPRVITFKKGELASDLNYEARVGMGYVSILLVKQGGFWRIWGFERNTA
jgi:hypothetical protein